MANCILCETELVERDGFVVCPKAPKKCKFRLPEPNPEPMKLPDVPEGEQDDRLDRLAD